MESNCLKERRDKKENEWFFRNKGVYAAVHQLKC